METKTIPTKTFKEVHEELENECIFLHQKHDIAGFREKAGFLRSIGFKNSIATKLYAAIADSSQVIDDYNRNYGGQYKFILEPQLERVCEKYNLYVRNVDYFLGDIPEKNIKEIMNFKIRLSDLPIHDQLSNQIRGFISEKTHSSFNIGPKMLSISDFSRFNLGQLLKIASVKSLLSDEAFKESNQRIIGNIEILPKNQVDLDPIVLCKTIHGYLIITAWGDEANDELVLNEKMN